MSARQIRSIVRWLVPSAVAALVPKCPVVLAVHVGDGSALASVGDLRMLTAVAAVALIFAFERRRNAGGGRFMCSVTEISHGGER